MEEIINLISKRDYSDDFIAINGTKEKISANNFRPINKNRELNFLFVDGGNAELLKSPDFSLQFVRILGICRKNGSKTHHLSEFYCFAKTELKENKKIWKIKNVFLKGKKIIPKDLAIEDAFQSPSAAAEFVRRLSEIALAADLSKTLSGNDVILLDGTLEAGCRTEAEFLLNLHQASKKYGVSLCSLAKTTAMQTSNGNSIISVFNAFGPKGKWHYQVKKDIPLMFFAKLHENSGYIFKFETNSEDANFNQKILGSLASASKDPVFIGYPFGLIEADRLARVSNREKGILKLELAARFGKLWKDVEKEETALNAHDILDNIG